MGGYVLSVSLLSITSLAEVCVGGCARQRQGRSVCLSTTREKCRPVNDKGDV